MISRTTPLWQQRLAEAVTSVEELLRLVDLPEAVLGDTEAARAAMRSFPLRVPRGFVARMGKGDPGDPLLRQVLPVGRESDPVPGFTTDPLGELAPETPVRPAPGVLHKYRGRALLVLTGACGVHCRYCFRRHFPYSEGVPGHGGWDKALDYLASDPSIEEVLLSGGDPLSLSDARLAPLIARLAAIPHLRRLRLHTRQPIVVPERVDDDLLAWLRAPAVTRLGRVVVLHTNHPAEIDRSVEDACRRLGEAGVTLLNQAVLLAGVNDDVDTLTKLGERLFEAGVLPYYLHLLDPVAGAAHFEVPEERARRLYRELLARAPGYLVPRLVREVEGAPSKVPVPMV